MTLRIQINVDSDDNGDLTDFEKSILAALAGQGSPTVYHVNPPAVSPEPTFYDAPVTENVTIPNISVGTSDAEASPTEDQQKVLDDVTVPEPEKPRRKRRTKAEIEAERAAKEAEEQGGSTGAGVLDTSLDEERPTDADEKQEALNDLGDTEAGDDQAEEAVADAQERAEAAGYPMSEDEVEDENAPAPKVKATQKMALDRATVLLGEGKGPKAKAIVVDMGFNKVSEIPDDRAQEFLDRVKNL